MSYKKIKLFADFIAINEGNIPAYQAGDKQKASKNLHVPDVAKFFYELIEKGKPFTAVVNNEGTEFGPVNKIDAESAEKWFNRLESEFDVIGVEGFDGTNTIVDGTKVWGGIYDIKSAEEAKKTNANNILIVLKSKDGRTWKTQIGKIEEVAVGNSIKDKISLNDDFTVDGMGKCYIYDYDGKTVSAKFADETKEFTLAEWKKLNKKDAR